MKVLKFGGTSVGTVNSLLNVKKIVESIEQPAVIVVSALGGLTDKLIETAGLAATGNPQWKEEMKNIEQRHYDIIENVIEENRREDIAEAISILLDELKRNYQGIELIADLPERTLNVVVSFGERMSSVIVAAMIKGGKRYNSLNFIKSEKWFGKNIADFTLTESLIKKEFEKPFNKAIVPGFISTDKDTEEITNLGRGGSDFTAALIAASLDAESLEIWTDVDGFMTADPRIVKEALVVPHMTFVESMELCTYGAKVIYPPTIYPVFHKNIPIKILNTFNPSAAGTLITDQHLPEDFKIKGVSALKNNALIILKKKIKDKDIELSGRSLNVLSKNGIRILPVNFSDETNIYAFSVADNELNKTLKLIKEEFAPEISEGSLSEPQDITNLTAIAVVGRNMKEQDRLPERIRYTLRRGGIEIIASSFGNSDTTLIYLIAQNDEKDSLKLTHSLLF